MSQNPVSLRRLIEASQRASFEGETRREHAHEHRARERESTDQTQRHQTFSLYDEIRVRHTRVPR